MITPLICVLHILLFAIYSGPVSGACPADYVEVGGSCFLVVETASDFSTARAACQERNGDLAVLSDCNLLGSVSEYLLASYPDNDVWVGGQDVASDGSWLWFDGTPVEMGAPFWSRISAWDFVYEPTTDIDKNCAAMVAGASYYFQAAECDDPGRNYSPLCEAPRDPATGSCPELYQEVGGNRCFQLLYTFQSTWTDARTVCQSSEGGDLAIMDDCHVMKSIIDLAEQTGFVPDEGFWVGGSDEVSEGYWQWIDGSRMAMGSPFWGMSGSGPLNPDNYAGVESCLSLFAIDRFYLNDRDCAYGGYPLCQTDTIL